MIDPEQAATELADAVGGLSNVLAVENCVTRLRFVLADPSIADTGRIGAMPAVVSAGMRAGQLQVVIGPEVADIYEVLAPRVAAARSVAPVGTSGEAGRDSGPRAGGRGSVIGRALDLITGTFQPLLWVLVGSSLIQTALTVGMELGWWDRVGPGYALIAAAGSAAFVFLPVLVGASAARKLGANQYVGAALGAALLDSHYTSLGPAGTRLEVVGVPLIVADYSQTVFPALLAAVMLAVLERYLRRRLPRRLHMLVIPALCLAVLVPLTLILFGPIANTVSDALSSFVTGLWSLSPGLAGAIMGGLWQVFVMFGVHWGFVPVILNDVSVTGSSLLTGPLVSAVLAQAAASAAVMLRTRNPELRTLAGASAVTGALAGVTEPAIYGVNLPLRRPFVFACLGGAVGGAIAALGGSAAEGFVFPSLLTLPSYLNVGSFGMQLAGCAAAVLVAFGLTWFAGMPDRAAGAVGEADPRAVTSAPPTLDSSASSAPPLHGPDAADSATLSVLSPMTGEVIALSEVADPLFARGRLGPGVAIRPSRGMVRAPVSGTVTSVARGRHAVVVSSESGVDVLVHVGQDTVTLGGSGFLAAVGVGEQVLAGDVLLLFDLPSIDAAADLASPVVIANAAALGEVEVLLDAGPVEAGQPLLGVQPGR